MKYSQHDEEQKLQEYFKGKTDGVFVDIGAADGVTNSNTRLLWESGWSGVLVEASPSAFYRLLANYATASNVTLIHAAICEQNGIVSFYECSTEAQWSSMDERWIELWKDKAIKRSVIGLRLDVLSLPQEPDLLSIDTEGMDLTILRSMPQTFRPKLIVAETDKFDDAPKIDEHLRSIGYRQLWSGIGNGAWEKV